MKSYSDTINDLSRSMAAKGETLITMKHLNIQGSEPKMAPDEATFEANKADNYRPNETDAERAERTGLSSLRMTDDASKLVQKTPHRISLDSIVAKIEHIDYVSPHRHPHMTIAIVTLRNGFIVLGKSTPADPNNYDEKLGQKFAYEDAVRQIWPLEAYLLREQLTAAGEYGKVG